MITIKELSSLLNLFINEKTINPLDSKSLFLEDILKEMKYKMEEFSEDKIYDIISSLEGYKYIFENRIDGSYFLTMEGLQYKRFLDNTIFTNSKCFKL